MGGLFQRKPTEPPRLTGDTVLPGVLAKLLQGDFSPAARLLSIDHAAERYFYAFELGQQVPREIVERLEGPAALLLRAAQGPMWAWQARSDQVASRVTEDQRQEFARRLQRVRSDIESLMKADSTDPNPYALMLIVSKGENRPRAELTKLCDGLQERDPGHYFGLRNYLDSILQKWGGNHEVALHFARQGMDKSPPGSPLGGLVMTALSEQWLYLDAFDKQPQEAAQFLREPWVIQETLAAYQQSLGSKHFTDSSSMVHVRNEVAFWLYLTAQKEPLRQELARIGQRFTSSPWDYLGQPGKIYAQARKYAGLR